MNDRIDRLEELLAGTVAALGLDLEEVSLTHAGKRRVLRVAVDRDGGVGIDVITDATREVSRVLDDSDVMGEQPYTLEVTSRGATAPLVLPRHWRRNAGRLVKVSLVDGTSVTGRIGDGSADDASDPTATLVLDDGVREIALADVTTAVVQVELNRKDV